MARAVRVQFYATARSAAGRERAEFPVAADGIRARDLVRTIAAEFPALRRILATSRFLRNDRYLTSLEERLLPGDLFSVHPPYSGG